MPISSFADDLSGQTSTRRYPPADVKYLYGAAAGRCAFPECRKLVLLPGFEGTRARQIGKIAHIVGHSDEGPRGDPSYPREKLDTYENWVLLCPTCHDTVDAQPKCFSTPFLRELKGNHERWVDQMLSAATANISFRELEVAVKGIAWQGTQIKNSTGVIPPDEKIRLNRLSLKARNDLVTGLMQAPLVQSFFIAMEKADGEFEKRVVKGFQEKYLELRKAGEAPDEIFYDLWRFASMGKAEFDIQAAGLALLSHLFEKCDVFEKTKEELRNASAD